MLQTTSKGWLLCRTFLPRLPLSKAQGRDRKFNSLFDSCTFSLNSVFGNPPSDLLLSASSLAASLSHGEAKGSSWVFIHLSGSSIWVARRQGSLLVGLEVFWGFLERH